MNSYNTRFLVHTLRTLILRIRKLDEIPEDERPRFNMLVKSVTDLLDEYVKYGSRPK